MAAPLYKHSHALKARGSSHRVLANANSLCPKRSEFLSFAPPGNLLNYKIYRNDRPNNEGGGTAIWSELLENIPTGDADAWKVSKALRETTKTFFPPIHGERGLVYMDEEKAEAFADSLERQFSPNMFQTDDLDFEEENYLELQAHGVEQD
ncbi:hypothetical protein HUJ04_001445 [Dendroctonus ponderosae]|nr:hypothetical protein HUJ04_001445 [Dendroctonus ponderosae]